MKRAARKGGLRLFSRLLAGFVALVLFTLVSIQFERVLNENIAMAHSLSSITRNVSALRLRKAREEREIRQLSDPEGAIPEIHQRLQLLRRNEAIIYLRRQGAGS